MKTRESVLPNLNTETLQTIRANTQRRRFDIIMGATQDYQTNRRVADFSRMDQRLGVMIHGKYVAEKNAQQTLADLAPNYRADIIKAMNMHDLVFTPTKGVYEQR